MPERKKTTRLSHVDRRGHVKMVDVSEKEMTRRTAVASARITMKRDVREKLIGGELAKGEAIVTAKIAGIQAAKNAGLWIPLCHPLALDLVDIDIVSEGRNVLKVTATVRTTGRTGAEMEALAAASAAALTLYDMAKAADKAMVIGPIQLESKRGGRSGAYKRRG